MMQTTSLVRPIHMMMMMTTVTALMMMMTVTTLVMNDVTTLVMTTVITLVMTTVTTLEITGEFGISSEMMKVSRGNLHHLNLLEGDMCQILEETLPQDEAMVATDVMTIPMNGLAGRIGDDARLQT